jgi:hypothetical protein
MLLASSEPPAGTHLRTELCLAVISSGVQVVESALYKPNYVVNVRQLLQPMDIILYSRYETFSVQVYIRQFRVQDAEIGMCVDLIPGGEQALVKIEKLIRDVGGI